MKKKIILFIFLLILISAVATLYYIFIYAANHRRSVNDEQCIEVTAIQLVNDYQTNETAANTKYLNKAIKITGIVGEVNKDQLGKTTITIKSNDAFANVFCTVLATTKHPPAVGASIIVKGFCTGFLSDVVINEAVVVTK